MFCGKVKEFLRQKGITYTEKDVSVDEQALEALMAMGFSATPVTLIDGEAVVGFNRARLEELLGA
ncbi:MAG: glutaredoxin family protein [Armatimonadetes bacterium]|nr:glutaredoxin family protein [Armatimonadota bacterium]